jgi:hypothetical protein
MPVHANAARRALTNRDVRRTFFMVVLNGDSTPCI